MFKCRTYEFSSVRRVNVAGDDQFSIIRNFKHTNTELFILHQVTPLEVNMEDTSVETEAYMFSETHE